MSSSYEPSTQSPAGPRRIREGGSAWREGLSRLFRGGLLAGGLIGLDLLRVRAGWGEVTTLPYLGVLVGASLLALNRLGLTAWLFFMACLGVWHGAAQSLGTPADDVTGPAVGLVTLCVLPWMGVLLHRPGLLRLGFSGRLRQPKDLALLGGIAGLGLPGLGFATAWLGQQALGPQLAPQPTWFLAIACAALSASAALFASGRRARQGRPELAWGLALLAVLAACFLALGRGPTSLLLAPLVLLTLHATRASARDTAWLAGLLALLALPSQPGWVPLSLALLPWITQALGAHGRREREGWRSALDAQGIALAEWRMPVKQGGGVRASQRWLVMTGGAEATHWDHGPLDWIRQVHPRDREATRRALRHLLADPKRDHLAQQFRLAPDGGDWRWHELHAHVGRRDGKGRARELVATLSDVTGRHVADERERMTAALFQHVQEGLAVLDSHWRVVEANPTYCDIVGSPREALVGHMAAPLAHNVLRRHGLELAQVQAALAAGKAWHADVQLERSGAAPLPVSLKLSAVTEADGTTPRWRVLGVADLSEVRQRQEQMQKLLRFDAATGLPNRDEFMSRLDQALLAARRDGFKLVICLIDLDDFAHINITHGQLLADYVLAQVAQRLQAALRAAPSGADQLARLHGDEFAVLVRVQNAEEALRAVERLATVLRTPVPVRESQVGRSVSVELSASLGVTVFPTDDADPETLLRHASHALYRAKQAGRGSVQFHDPSSSQRDEAGLIALARLQRALDEGELRLHYQPQINLQTGQLQGLEALLRWQHPERGLLPAAQFLPLAETTGLSIQIGDWVIEQALQQLSSWRLAGLDVAVSVNVGARQLRRADFPQRLQELVQRVAADNAARLQLDVLEADALAHTEPTNALIQRCLALGIGIALDDFGGGYSRLSAMKRLPVDTLKLSRQLVQGMLADAQDRSLVVSVIGLARNMGCAVVAKGVESPAHARELLRLGCRLGQGNAIAAAMPPEALPGWMAGFAAAHWPQQVQAGLPPLKLPKEADR